MFDRKEAKKTAKSKLKKHYFVFVLSCLLAAWIGIDYTSSVSVIKSNTTRTVSLDTTDETTGNIVWDLVTNSLQEAEETSNDLKQQSEESESKIANISIGHTNGVLASFVNIISSGSIFVILYKTVTMTLGAKEIFGKLLIILAAFFLFLINILITNVYSITYKRIFLESYHYDEIKTHRFLFIFKVHKWLQVAWACFVKDIYLFLWSLTIVGIPIKILAYSQTDFILAENPSLSPNQAITLSRKMMYGHKWELFLQECTFLGWWILDTFTLGFTGILFSNPYHEAFRTEYYAYVRSLAIENKIENYEYLNDIYLYEDPTQEQLSQAYGDLEKNAIIDTPFPEYKGFSGFLAKTFGIVFKYDKKSDQYYKALYQHEKAELYKDIFNNENYPARLCPLKETEKAKKDTVILSQRLYSVVDLIMIFFIFSFIGWVWEVSLHLVQSGEFVNRGVLQGPWLPVYGSGILLILVILYRCRKSIPLQFLSAVVLCGFVEYFTAYFLELTHNGMKWWDYTGYFLNIDGRICAEGLFVFGLGGCVAVYIVAPLIDNFLQKLNKKWLTIVAILLCIIFITDDIYSKFHPNTGKGITDYNTSYVLEEEEKLC